MWLRKTTAGIYRLPIVRNDLIRQSYRPYYVIETSVVDGLDKVVSETSMVWLCGVFLLRSRLHARFEGTRNKGTSIITALRGVGLHPLSQWCILYIPPYFHKISKFPLPTSGKFINSSHFFSIDVFSLIYVFCFPRILTVMHLAYASCITRTGLAHGQ